MSGGGGQSPSHHKRKMPDTFHYPPPVVKTQLFTAVSSPSMDNAVQSPQRIIHHAHTNSLPVDPATMMPGPHNQQQQQQQQINQQQQPYYSAVAAYQASSSTYQTPCYTVVDSQQPTYATLTSAKQSQPMMTFNAAQPSPQHSKTFSLPVSFETNPSNASTNSSLLPPPVRTFNSHGDIPLPPGWDFQQTSNGQFYYINQMTKTTTWEDPRKTIYNLPSNQSDIGEDMRVRIKTTIPLPSGWEEATTPSGELYYINHNNRMTTWEDPRIRIYMQQEHFKYQQQQSSSSSMRITSCSYTSSMSNSSSSSSLNSCSVITNSSSSSSSSLQSLTNPSSNGHTRGQFGAATTTAVTTAAHKSQNRPAMRSNEALIASLRKSLDQILSQKSLICKQIDDLNKQEVLLRSKLSPQDFEDISKHLKSIDKASNTSSKPSENAITTKSSETISENNNTSNTELDSTFIADNSANNLNISAS